MQLLGATGLPSLPAALSRLDARAAASLLDSLPTKAQDPALAAVPSDAVATAAKAATAAAAAAASALHEVQGAVTPLFDTAASAATRILAGETVSDADAILLVALPLVTVILTVLSAATALSLLQRLGDAAGAGGNLSEKEARRIALESLRREKEAIAGGLPTEFEASAVGAYFRTRPLQVVSRAADVLRITGGLILGILYDAQVASKEDREARAPQRAQELTDALTRLGPAFVKVGQALSIRPDFLPAPYPQYLSTLQDGVQAFDSKVARAILEEELGRPLSDAFEDASGAFETPVAAASLGQVYRATVRGGPLAGKDVAVKVQRPGLLERCTVDLFVIRALLLLTASVFGAESRAGRNALATVGVVEVYGARFVDELDYTREARATERLGDDLEGVENLRDAVLVPQVESSSRHAIVTEWIEGVKITSVDVSAPEEKERVQNYVAVLLNVYLAQLLDTGFLHSDPHPGNFLLVPDGRIAILDCGLMTEVTKEQQGAMVKYVAHLTSGQYDKTVEDLVSLGFLDPALSEVPENRAIVAPILAEVLSALSQGGGTKAFQRVDRERAGLPKERTSLGGVSDELQRLAKDYPLTIPPYFALIIRAFSTLEGLGLRNDPDYSIVDACFPYLCRRLLGKGAKDDAALREALDTFLYGDKLERDVADVLPAAAAAAPHAAAGAGAHAPQLDVQKLEDVIDGFSKFKDAGAIKAPAGGADGERQAKAAQQLLGEVFGEEGSYLEDVLVSEAVRLTDAVVREAVGKAAEAATSGPLPPPPAFGTLKRLASRPEDREAAEVAGRLADLAKSAAGGAEPGALGTIAGGAKSLLPKELRGTAAAKIAFDLLPAIADGIPRAAVAAATAQRNGGGGGGGAVLQSVDVDTLRAGAQPVRRVGSKFAERLRTRARERIAQDLEEVRGAGAQERVGGDAADILERSGKGYEV